MLIRRLTQNERPLFAQHLKRLSPDDRYCRFTRAGVDDDWIDAHVAALPADDLILAVRRDDQVIAAAHVALGEDQLAEIGLSVDAAHRAEGLGSQLFHEATLFARNRGAERLFTLCLTDNRSMLALARRAGMRLNYAGSEAEAHLLLPPPDSLTLTREMSAGLFAVVQDWAVLLDHYGAKLSQIRDGVAPAPPPERQDPAALRSDLSP